MSTQYDRDLSPEEREQYERVEPALLAWAAYLDDPRNNPDPDFDRAEQRGAPVIVRRTRRDAAAVFSALAVRPQFALTWAMSNGYGRHDVAGRPLLLTDMFEALQFMNADEYTLFQAKNDTCQRRRAGYWQVSAEIHGLLRSKTFVPSLAPKLGRPRARRPLPEPLRGRRHPRPVPVEGDGAAVGTLLADFLRTTDVTALERLAVEQGRPLATRPPGRPPRRTAVGPGVRRDEVVAHIDALTNHLHRNYGRLRMRPATRDDVRAMLRAYASSNPSTLQLATQFSSLDGGQRRKQQHWWRIRLQPLGVREIDPADLVGEVSHWERTTADRIDPATERAPVTDAYPAGFDPAYADDAEYVDTFDWTGLVKPT